MQLARSSFPRLPQLKEWGYAIIFFNVTGAAARHAALAFQVAINLVFFLRCGEARMKFFAKARLPKSAFADLGHVVDEQKAEWGLT
jgi:hypothetical protein